MFFYGCSVGYGRPGKTFLSVAGREMLGHGGGVVLAATSMTLANPLLGIRLPPWGSVVVAEVQPGGKVTFLGNQTPGLLPSWR